MTSSDTSETQPKLAPYGSWRSPITSDLVAISGILLGEVSVDGDNIYWVEGRPQEGGRCVLVRRNADGTRSDLTPPPFNVRTCVHEYGGGASWVTQGVAYFSNFTDNAFYRLEKDGTPEVIANHPRSRYTDAVLDSNRQRLLAVREEHPSDGSECINLLVSIPLNGSTGERIVTQGADFYSNPRLSPDGQHLAWLCWNHPNMPWTNTELWIGTLDTDGNVISSRQVAGMEGESIFQPEWSPDGILYFVSDKTGWWNLYREKNEIIEAVLPMEAEFGRAQWGFRMSTYAFISESQLACTYLQKGQGYFGLLDLESGALTKLATPYTEFSQVRATPYCVVMLAGSPTQASALVRFDLAISHFEVLQSSSLALPDNVHPGYFSTPRFVEFPSGERTAYGWFYPPANPGFHAPAGEKPPLIVKCHGGPTSAASSSLNLRTQYWTSRGYAVMDVDYGGSTGYGRPYRDLLNNQWGIIDVEDCANAVAYLAEKGWADGARAMITGGSAGGYTTLCALTFGNAFHSGASHYGVSDLEALATDTHKFESRYLDGLIGKYPEEKALYQARSPIHFSEQLSVPIIFFQGEDDKVVPPNQAEIMVEAIRKKGLPVGYLLFKGEGHGFRKAENIQRTLDAELYFYSSLIVKAGLQC